MSDAFQEAGDMLNDLTRRISVLMDLFTVEATALAWKLAAEVMVAELPRQLAVGSLSWKGRPEKAKLAMPVMRKPGTDFVSVTRKPGVDLGPPKVKILGPKPEAKAKRFEELIDRKIGKWARRDGKVSYICVGKSGAFCTMKRTDNGEDKKVKFASIVRDWIYIQ